MTGSPRPLPPGEQWGYRPCSKRYPDRDHEVEDDIHVKAASRKRAHALDFEEKRKLGLLLGSFDDRIKAFEMADLQNTIVPIRSVDQRIRRRQIVGDRLFDQ